jgi:hypothetical protein
MDLVLYCTVITATPSPPMYKTRPRSCVCSRYKREREEDVGCGRDKEKEENQIREMIIASTKVLR